MSVLQLPIEKRMAPGDIIAFYGRSMLSRVIEVATWGPSHVGMVVEWERPNRFSGHYFPELMLIESTTLCPRACRATGEMVKGVQLQSIDERVADYEGEAEIFRLADHWTFSGEESTKLMDLCRSWLGRPYDYYGAVLSGSRIIKYLPGIPYKDLGTLFCSNMIAALLQRMGPLCVSNPRSFNPGSLVRTLVKAGAYLPGEPL